MICGAMLRSGEMQIWEWGCLCGREGSNWGSCSWEWRGRGHEDPGLPKSCVLCRTPTARFILKCFQCHVKTAILRAVNWASNSSLPSAGCTCWGFLLIGSGVRTFPRLVWVGLCCCTDRTVWCWPGLGGFLWSLLLQCWGVPVFQVFTPSRAPLS